MHREFKTDDRDENFSNMEDYIWDVTNDLKYFPDGPKPVNYNFTYKSQKENINEENLDELPDELVELRKDGKISESNSGLGKSILIVTILALGIIIYYFVFVHKEDYENFTIDKSSCNIIIDNVYTDDSDSGLVRLQNSIASACENLREFEWVVERFKNKEPDFVDSEVWSTLEYMSKQLINLPDKARKGLPEGYTQEFKDFCDIYSQCYMLAQETFPSKITSSHNRRIVDFDTAKEQKFYKLEKKAFDIKGIINKECSRRKIPGQLLLQ